MNIAPNKRFLRAVREERVFVKIYNHDTRGQTWWSTPFGMWFYNEHLEAGYVEPVDETRSALFQEPGVVVVLTEKGKDWLNVRGGPKG